MEFQSKMPIVLSTRETFGGVKEMSFNKISDFSGTATYCWGLGLALHNVPRVQNDIYPSEFFQPRESTLGKFWLISLDMGNCELSVEAYKPPPEGTNVKFAFCLNYGSKTISVTSTFNENEIGKYGGYVLCKVIPHFWHSASNTIEQLKEEECIHIIFTLTYQLPKPNLTQLMALANDLSVLREEKISADIVLCVKGAAKFPAHSTILSARSKKFAAMFNQEMSEKEPRRVDINDLEPDVVKALLDFIYCANIDDAMDVPLVFRLRIAAGKYDMPDLQNACDDFVITLINEENVIALSLAADAYSALPVKEATTEFINHNYEFLDFQKNKDVIKNKRTHALIDIMEYLQKSLSTKSWKYEIV